jgi:PKD repeat protein
MKKKILFLIIIAFQTLSWSQNHRYTATLFPSSTSINNVIYGSAPAVDGPLYTMEQSTSPQNLIMDIFKPAGDTFALRPAIIFAHSGAFYTGNRNVDDMMTFCDSLAKKGYVTATIDYRQGFSLIDNIALHGTRAVYRGLQDGRTAIRFLRANAASYGIDPTKIYFVGSSAGAFIALHSIYLDTPSEKPTYAGETVYQNFTAPYTHTAPDLGGLDIGNNLTFNGMPDAIVSMWGALESVNLITVNNNKPVFLIHGEADTVVPFNSGSPFGSSSLPPADGSNPINTKLDALGITNKETYFVPGAGHELYGASNGTWSNGTGGNSYWPIVFNKIVQFLWKQHKPTADYSWNTTNLTTTFNDLSTGDLAWWWDFGDGTTSNLQNPSHTYTTSGNYQVKLYVENNIQSWDEIIKIVQVPNLSNFENNKQLFSVFPNPTSENVSINWDSNITDVMYQISDISGKVILENKITNSNRQIDLQHFSKGLYFIKITTENATQILKIIKK